MKPRLFIHRLVAGAIALISTLTSSAQTINSIAQQAIHSEWVDSVMSSLTPRERVAQLFVPKINPANEADARRLIDIYIKECGMGGLLFSRGSISQFASLTDYANAQAATPLMMTLDGEWGPAMRVNATVRFPYNMALGAIDNEQLLYDYGYEVARQCRLLGVQVNFAPVLDVNSNPANPVIGYRSFGEDPNRVARLATAYARGLEAGGVMAVGKHFPGHGDTSKDSHKELPTVDHSRQTLTDVDLVPFRHFIEANLSGIMVAHLNVPALDTTATPSSLSHAITTKLLKEQMGFDGIVWTDGLAMKGAATGHENNCISALKAGADILLESANPKSDLEAVCKAVAAGIISRQTIDTRCRKVLAYKYALGLADKRPTINSTQLESGLNSSEAHAINRRLCEAMITCLSNHNHLLPLSIGATKIGIVNIGDTDDNTFVQTCRSFSPRLDVVISSADTLSEASIDSLRRCNIVIAAVYNDKPSSAATIKQLRTIKNLATVFFLNPYKLSMFGSVASASTLLVGDNTAMAQECGAQALFGGIDVDGTLPVNVDGVAPIGSGINLSKSRLSRSTPEAMGFNPRLSTIIDSIAQRGLSTGAFTGCQVLVAKSGRIIVDSSYGFTDTDKRQPVTRATIFDLASVSKITGTLPGLMAAYDDGLFSIDAPAKTYLPSLSPDAADISIKQLLFHESGLPASISLTKFLMDTASFTGPLIAYRKGGNNTIPISSGVFGNQNARLRSDLISATPDSIHPYAVARDIFVGTAMRDSIMDIIRRITPRPDHPYIYSDLNFALLMDMEQRLTGISHERYVAERLFTPLGMTHTRYRPEGITNVAATEVDPFLRRQHICGYVHDELAAFSGGVQGNAGLFSNAGDLAVLCQMWLNRGTYGRHTLLTPSTVDLFTTTKSTHSRRKLGFDGPDTTRPESSPVAAAAHPSTFGHTGFTGTCVWVDPASELIFIFLSNRINPTRDNAAFTRLNPRQAIMSAIYEAM